MSLVNIKRRQRPQRCTSLCGPTFGPLLLQFILWSIIQLNCCEKVDIYLITLKTLNNILEWSSSQTLANQRAFSSIPQLNQSINYFLGGFLDPIQGFHSKLKERENLQNFLFREHYQCFWYSFVFTVIRILITNNFFRSNAWNIKDFEQIYKSNRIVGKVIHWLSALNRFY